MARTRSTMIQEELLRRAVREILISEVTVGDLKATIAAIKKEKNVERAKAAAKIAGKAGVTAVIGAIPGGGAVVKAIETAQTLADLYSAVKDVDAKTKKSNPLMDDLTIDPDTSDIVDDAIEARFMKALGDKLEAMNDADEIPDADKTLALYLKGEYSGAHVTK